MTIHSEVPGEVILQLENASDVRRLDVNALAILSAAKNLGVVCLSVEAEAELCLRMSDEYPTAVARAYLGEKGSDGGANRNAHDLEWLRRASVEPQNERVAKELRSVMPALLEEALSWGERQPYSAKDKEVSDGRVVNAAVAIVAINAIMIGVGEEFVSLASEDPSFGPLLTGGGVSLAAVAFGVARRPFVKLLRAARSASSSWWKTKRQRSGLFIDIPDRQPRRIRALRRHAGDGEGLKMGSLV